MDATGVTDGRAARSWRRCAASSRAAFTTSTSIEHTRAVLAETIALERDPEPVFGAGAGRCCERCWPRRWPTS